MPIGRNVPCPCGSGKKYKRCHGADPHGPVFGGPSPGADSGVARATTLKARDVRLGERLMRFARERYGPHWLFDTLDSEGLLDDDDVVPENALSLVIPWLQHYRADENGMTLAEEWRREQRQLAADDGVLLEAYDSAWLSLWEVTEAQPGRGSQLIDVLTRETRFVHDVRSASTLRRFDTILAIVLTCDGVSFFGGVHAQPLPPHSVEAVARTARRSCGVRTRSVPLERLRDPGTQLDLIELWQLGVQELLDRPLPVIRNTDGDPLLLTRDDFALLGPPTEVARQLLSLPGIQPPEREGNDTVFTVVKAGNAMHRSWDNTITGRIVLSSDRLRVETNSIRRADSLRDAIETQLRDLVRFRLRKEEDTDQLMAASRAAGRRQRHPASEELPPEALAELREFRERHLGDWLDQAIPALDGLTPLQAAREPRARTKVLTLLKEIEQREAVLPEGQRIDLGWVWKTLGLR
jgi:hypothetical protein